MEVRTFDTILTGLCDTFDTLITPRKIARTNTNVIYLLFKAFSKGLELINNICVALSNKFDPENCSEEDLLSVADLVGTERLAGSSSGLLITVSNDTEENITLEEGVYYYALDDDTKFIFEVFEDTVITPSASVSYIAMSEEVGEYAVTEQQSIEVLSDIVDVPSELTFSCEDNSELLGASEETILEFRQRILSDTTRQNVLNELEIALKNLPYLYDAKVVLNQSVESVQVGNFTLPSYCMAVFYSGSPRSEMAEVVANHGIYPTLSDVSGETLRYYSGVFASGYYDVNIIPFANLEYNLALTIKVDTTYISSENAQRQITSYLEKKLRAHRHTSFVKEEDIYNVLSNLTVTGVSVLNVDIMQNGSQVPYITVPESNVPYLSDVSFTEV